MKKTFLVSFQNDTGTSLFRCHVHTDGDRNRAINIACHHKPQWFARCEQVLAFELKPNQKDAKAPHH